MSQNGNSPELAPGMEGRAGSGAQLTLRGILLGALGAVVITTSSMYVALRMGALPWPTIFVAVLSMALLKGLGRTNVNEINVTHTAMSAGGMVAGGLAFTLPGLYMLNPEAPMRLPALLAVTLSGTLLGVVFTALVRGYFIERERLPFPMGIAAAETVLAGDERGSKARTLFGTLGAAAVFTLLRDAWGKIPAVWISAPLAARGVPFGVWVAPMAAGIGYLIGPLYTGVWFLGSLIGFFGLIYAGVSLGLFADAAAASAFKDSLGIGLMVGTGAGILVKGILPRAREIYGPMLSGRAAQDRMIGLRFAPLLPVVLAFVLTYIAGLSILGSVLTILGVWVTTAMAAQITGQTGINPMEIFGIIVLLLVKAASSFGTELGVEQAFYVAGVVAVACGLTGDVLNDFKSGHTLGTNPRAQLAAEVVGGLIGAVVSVLVLVVMYKAFGRMGPGTELPAPQAYAVSTMVGGLPHTKAFILGLLLGLVFYLLNVPAMTLGIGVYLPMFISGTVFLGGALAFAMRRLFPDRKGGLGVVVASGLLGGEGITGVLIAIGKVLSFLAR